MHTLGWDGRFNCRFFSRFFPENAAILLIRGDVLHNTPRVQCSHITSFHGSLIHRFFRIAKIHVDFNNFHEIRYFLGLFYIIYAGYKISILEIF